MHVGLLSRVLSSHQSFDFGLMPQGPATILLGFCGEAEIFALHREHSRSDPPPLGDPPTPAWARPGLSACQGEIANSHVRHTDRSIA